MQLKNLLPEARKAQLQGYYLYWFPGKEMISVRERLAGELCEVMTDHVRVRQRFDALSRAQQGFLVALLLRRGYSGTVSEVRDQKHGRIIEDFEVENILKSLQEAGYIVRTSGTGGYSSEVFSIPEELGDALRRTISVEERQPMEMMSLRAHIGTNGNGVSDGSEPSEGSDLAAWTNPEGVFRRVQELAAEDLRRLVVSSLEEHGGILTLSALNAASLGAQPSGGALRLSRADWRRELESQRLGTTGVLSLKDYGIELEEEGLVIYQEIVCETSLAAACIGPAESDREVCMGADLIIDLDRSLEVLRREALEITREGNVYKKIEDRISGQFVTTHHPELHDGSAVGNVIDLGRKLQFFEEENQRMVVDPLRRRVWRKKPLLEKVAKVFDVYRAERRGHRWSFHQTALREIFIDHLRRIAPGSWLAARPFFTAVIARYLLGLEESKVSAEFHERCTGDFKNETLVVSLPKLYHDLSYWVVHRLGLLGVIDAGYRGGAFQALRLSRLGMRFFAEDAVTGSTTSNTTGSAAPVSTSEMRILVNPDFEILIYPESPEEASWTVSLFADRQGSDKVKRYKLSRESVKRGIVAGLTREDMIVFLEKNAHGAVPPNVLFSVKEWTDGVELVRLQKVHLLRAHSCGGADRLAAILEAREIPFERLNDTTVLVRGGKNERAVKDLQEHFRDHGLFVE